MEKIANMPGTFHPSVKSLRWRRGADVVEPATGATSRVYDAEAVDGFLRAMVSHDRTMPGPLWHLSVSHRDKAGQPDRCPNWDELKHAKYSLCPVDVAMVLIFPRKDCPAHYVNDHATTLHLWESTEKDVDL